MMLWARLTQCTESPDSSIADPVRWRASSAAATDEGVRPVFRAGQGAGSSDCVRSWEELLSPENARGVRPLIRD